MNRNHMLLAAGAALSIAAQAATVQAEKACAHGATSPIPCLPTMQLRTI